LRNQTGKGEKKKKKNQTKTSDRQLKKNPGESKKVMVRPEVAPWSITGQVKRLFGMRTVLSTHNSMAPRGALELVDSRGSRVVHQQKKKNQLVDAGDKAPDQDHKNGAI